MQTRLYLLALSLLMIFSCDSLFGQDSLSKKIIEWSERSEKEYSSRTRDEKKLESRLFQLMKESEVADSSVKAKEQFKKNLRSMEADPNDRVNILIETQSVADANTVVNLVQSLGGTVATSGKDSRYIDCWVHPKALRALSSSKGIRSIEKTVRGFTRRS